VPLVILNYSTKFIT